jgi:FixJ family two-component response regulator
MTRPSLVVVVDDDDSLRRSVENLLDSVGMRVRTFASGEDLLRADVLGEAGCLVLDLRLEGMTGLDVMAHLSAAGQAVPVVMLTAHGDEEVRQQALKAGARAFLAKPFRPDELVPIIEQLLAGS